MSKVVKQTLEQKLRDLEQEKSLMRTKIARMRVDLAHTEGWVEGLDEQIEDLKKELGLISPIQPEPVDLVKDDNDRCRANILSNGQTLRCIGKEGHEQDDHPGERLHFFPADPRMGDE